MCKTNQRKLQENATIPSSAQFKSHRNQLDWFDNRTIGTVLEWRRMRAKLNRRREWSFSPPVPGVALRWYGESALVTTSDGIRSRGILLGEVLPDSLAGSAVGEAVSVRLGSVIGADDRGLLLLSWNVRSSSIPLGKEPWMLLTRALTWSKLPLRSIVPTSLLGKSLIYSTSTGSRLTSMLGGRRVEVIL